MLKTRVITAVLLVTGLLISVFLASNQVWAILTLCVALLATAEWASLIRLDRAQTFFYVMGTAFAGVLIHILSKSPLALYQQPIILSLLGLSVLFWLFIAPFWLISRKHCQHRLIMSGLGVLLIITTWLGLVGLHSISPWFLISCIAIVSLADSAAYFAGKRFGRNKLAPEISPGKTWEGVMGALSAVTVLGVMLCYFMQYSLWLIIVLWLLVVLSIVGDLFESLLKRQAGLKDSGQLLPGHGGVLDRIDGLIPTLPVILFCVYFFPIFLRLRAHG